MRLKGRTQYETWEVPGGSDGGVTLTARTGTRRLRVRLKPRLLMSSAVQTDRTTGGATTCVQRPKLEKKPDSGKRRTPVRRRP